MSVGDQSIRSSLELCEVVSMVRFREKHNKRLNEERNYQIGTERQVGCGWAAAGHKRAAVATHVRGDPVGNTERKGGKGKMIDV